MSEKPKDNPPDLFDAVDSLLEDIDETAENFTPKGEEAIDPNALVADEGSVGQAPSDSGDSATDTQEETKAASEAEDEVNTEQTDTAPSPEADEDVPVDSIENAQQALDALDEVEAQAAELTSQSIDALLDAEVPESSEHEESTEATPEPEADSDTDAASASEGEAADEDLLASIDDLLEETEAEVDSLDALESAVDDLINEAELETEPDTEPDPVAESGDDTDDETDESGVSAEAEVDADPVAEDTEEQDELDDLLDESSLIVEKHEPSVSNQEDDSIDLLDSALAEAADDMLDGDFEDEEGELVSGEAVATPIEQALEEELDAADPPVESTTSNSDEIEDIDLEDALSGLGEAETEPEAAGDEPQADATTQPDSAEVAIDSGIDELLKDVDDQSPAPAQPEAAPAAAAAVDTETSAPQSAEAPESGSVQDAEVLEEISALEQAAHDDTPAQPPKWFVRAVEVSRPKIDKIDPFNGKSMDTFSAVVGQLIVLISTHAAPVGARAMIVVSKPLSKQSPEIRNAIGFIALWTAFVAGVLWIYLLMFRTPNIPQPETAPTRVIQADESAIAPPTVTAEE
ncbi:MAG: hypothetical protein JJ974_05440 [Phycisphaerales bacterium]|nr:hypothetical protein [Phycisphaerales bacterium]